MDDNTIYAIPGTMCDDRIWSRLNESPLGFSIQHVEIPSDDHLSGIIEQLARQLPPHPINLMGFSLGGYLSGVFCANFPERIKKLAVLSNAPDVLPENEVKQRRQLIRWVRKHGYSGISDSKVEFLLHTDNRHRQDIVDVIKAMDKSLGTDVLLQQLSATTDREDLTPHLIANAVPIMFIYGEQDRLVDAHIVEHLASIRKNSYRDVIRGAGHMLPLENPVSLANALNKWFN